MPVTIHRIDDRLIHGQVVVGWGTPLDLEFIVLMDDQIAETEWEQDLYKCGTTSRIQIIFATVADTIANYSKYNADTRNGMILTGSVSSMLHLIEGVPSIKHVNVGGLHHSAGKQKKLRYVYLDQPDIEAMHDIKEHGVDITAQDVPSARPVTLEEILKGED